ncbi:MAG: carbohydrate kinase family protein [Rhodoferax sp.]|uniref:carbohydrate kinase family protein n=1 Tax=Rhodoferax sp. TaxID=50421 RepID=UPI00140030F7|nr:carbohydrate kinase family protein [Rhodoferax sp.]NDP40746.1 carbohydrate kinase family protein [Rhodoferax sp.]
MTDLVVIGLAYFEVFVPPHVRPPPGEELFIDGIQLALGGALNTATVAAALGLRVTLCVPMGHGIVDQAVALLAQRLGITLAPLPARDNPAISLVFSDANDRAFVSTAELDVLVSVKRLPASAWVHVPGLEEAARLGGPLALARQDGARISVSGSWSPRQLSVLAERKENAWDLLVLNEKEAQAACGDVAAAPQVLAQAAHSVLVTLGAQGVVGVLNAVPVRVPALPVKVVDATGAGDAFCAGVIAGLVRGLTPEASVRLGTRTAAKILNQIGGLVTKPGLMADLANECLWKP